MLRSQKPVPFARALTLGFALAAALLVTLSTQPSCKNTQQAENAVFTTEQLVCMVIPLTEGLLTGTPEEIAADVVKACPTLEGFTTEVVSFVNQWIKNAPAAKERWKAFVAASGKGARVYPVAATDANAPADARLDAH